MMGDLQVLSPLWSVFLFGLFVMIVPFIGALRGSAGRSNVFASTLIGLVLALVLDLWLFGQVGQGVLAYHGAVRVDSFALFVHVIVELAAIGMLFVGQDHLERIDVRVPEYYALVLFAVLGMLLLAVSNELLTMFVAIEIMSIAIYILCAINRGDYASVEGAFKYFIMGAFSSAILLYGIAFVYGATATTRIDQIAQWFATGHTLHSDPLAAVGLALLIVGFGFKVAAVPFHMWSPDAYQGAPTSVTSFMATGVKAASFAALGRVLLVGFLGGKAEWVGVLWAMSAITILVGNIGALVQTDLKRMLAYSSIGHAGYLLMAMVAAPATGLSGNPRVGGLLFYLLAYTIMTVGAFAVVSLFTRDGRDDARLDRLRGLGGRHPALAAGLSVCLLSLAGIPPTMGFVGKFYLFAAAVEGGFPGLAVVGAIGGAIGVYYYLRPLVLMYMEPDAGEAEPSVNRAALGALLAAVTLIALGGVFPGVIIDWCRESLMSLGG